jgi:hypothetical protein
VTKELSLVNNVQREDIPMGMVKASAFPVPLEIIRQRDRAFAKGVLLGHLVQGRAIVDASSAKPASFRRCRGRLNAWLVLLEHTKTNQECHRASNALENSQPGLL